MRRLIWLVTIPLVVLAGLVGAFLAVTRFAEAAIDPAIRTCDAAVQSMMKSPSSYRRVDAVVAGDKPEVILTYDASNPLGVVLRDTANCTFKYEPSRIADVIPDSPGEFSLAGVDLGSRVLTPAEVLIVSAEALIKVGGISENATTLHRPSP